MSIFTIFKKYFINISDKEATIKAYKYLKFLADKDGNNSLFYFPVLDTLLYNRVFSIKNHCSTSKCLDDLKYKLFWLYSQLLVE